MPGRKAGKRLIPIQKRGASDIQFRFVAGRLQIDRPGDSGIKWASCAIKEGMTKVKPPKMMTRSMGSIGGVVLFETAKMLKFKGPCSQDISQQTQNRQKVRK